MERVNSDLIRGNVDTILLKCLASGEKYGLEIIAMIKKASFGTYVLKQPTLYSALTRLEKAKLISSYWQDSSIGGKRHYYKLTEAGKNTLVSKKDDWMISKEIIDNLVFDDVVAVDTTRVAAGNVAAVAVEALVPETQAVLAGAGLENAVSSIEVANANLAELNREQTVRYEQLFAEARKTILGDEITALAGARIANDDYITVPLFGNMTPKTPVTYGDTPFAEGGITDEIVEEKPDTLRTDGLLKYLTPEEYETMQKAKAPAPVFTSVVTTDERIEIRSFVKHAGCKKSGKFCNYSNLRLFCASVLCVAMIAGLAVCYALLKGSYSASENTVFLLGGGLAIFYLLIHTAYFAAYPKVKKTIKSRKWDLLRRGLIAAGVVIAAVSVNLVMGLSGINYVDYLAYCAVPGILALGFFIEGIAICALHRRRLFSA